MKDGRGMECGWDVEYGWGMECGRGLEDGKGLEDGRGMEDRKFLTSHFALRILTTPEFDNILILSLFSLSLTHF